jgi:hypothetical protein
MAIEQIGSLDWLENQDLIAQDAVELVADLIRERWLELGGDDRPWQEWITTVYREYDEDDLADMRCKVAKAVSRGSTAGA